MGAPARHDIVTFGKLVEQARDVGRVVLTIAIHRDDHVAGTVLETGHDRSGLAVIAPQVEHLNAIIGLGKRDEHSAGPVARAIVDKQYLGRFTQPVQYFRQILEELWEGSRFVVDRNDDRKIHKLRYRIRLACSNICRFFSISNGRSSKVSGSHSLRAAAKKSPP